MAKSKKEKIVIEQGIQEQKKYYQNKYDKEKSKVEDPAKPNLLKRVGSILLDALIIVVTTGLLVLLASITIFEPLGFNASKDYITETNNASKLYNTDYGENITYLQVYDSKKTPEENLEEPIILFYTTNSKAVANNKINSYYESKIGSSLFEYNENNEIVRKKDITDAQVKTFLENEYNKALDYLHLDLDYAKAINNIYTTLVFTLIFSTMISFCIYFLTIPMLTKDHVSLGQKICKLAVVNAEDKLPATRKQITIRFIINYLLNGLAPICLFTLGIETVGIPFLLTLIMICFTRSNSGPHDYISHTKVINNSRSNAFEILESMKEQTAEQAEKVPHYYKEEKIHYTDDD